MKCLRIVLISLYSLSTVSFLIMFYLESKVFDYLAYSLLFVASIILIFWLMIKNKGFKKP